MKLDANIYQDIQNIIDHLSENALIAKGLLRKPVRAWTLSILPASISLHLNQNNTQNTFMFGNFVMTYIHETRYEGL